MSMEIPAKYDPIEKELKWYSYWMDNGFFRSQPDERKAYTIVIPPPNVTGVLHMGHMLNNTIQDVLVRRARMMGKNACWVPGTDHASIATEAKVVDKLKKEGIDKASLTRDEFLKHAWEWKEKHGGIILEQLKKLGASCDWERTAFTMDKDLSDSVIKVFIDLYNKGLVYRGVRMVNWDPQAKTAVSDEEVIYSEENSKLYYLKYKVAGSENEFVTIATTRPETILGDTAVCLNPNDQRYVALHGKKVLVPLINREIPIILDDYVDMEFGTGCLKVTPAHDMNDYELGIKHNLESIDIFNDNGTLSEAAQLYVGLDRFEVRKQIVPDLEAKGHIAKIEPYQNKVGKSERTGAVIEPKLSLQWFLKMEALAKPALDAVMNDDIVLYPPKYKNTYRHWMENVRDWCISRQLWWGHRIPAYYIGASHDFVIAENLEKALEAAKQKTGNSKLTANDLRQDEDVLDTWFSSWLWPISVFNGINEPNNADIKYYYPTNDLVTAPEILFFWVARMIMAGFEYEGKMPFKNVYLTGIVRDKLGRKMSKSLGNSPDPIELMKVYGADGVRVGMLFCSPAGGDLLFDESLTEQGRNFANKIWNAFRLVKGWNIDTKAAQPQHSAEAVLWMNNKLSETIQTIDKQFEEYRISDALMTVYKLFWDDYAAWFLEIIKPPFGEGIDAKTYSETAEILDKLLKLLHPFMPFITEEIWQTMEERKAGESLMMQQMPKAGSINADVLAAFATAQDVVSKLRNIRKEKNIALKDALNLMVSSSEKLEFASVISKLANLGSIENVSAKPEGAISFMSGTAEFYVPLAGKIDVAEEIAKAEKEIEYLKGFLNSVLKKLSNDKFVAGAPAQVIDAERKKQADAETKIKALEELIASFRA